MGCDVHLYVEELQSVNNEQKWVCLDSWNLNPYHGVFDDEPIYSHRSFYHGRDYELFQALAGVRGEEVQPASDPKGLPRDVSAAVKKESDEWGSDGHSHSWLLFSEIYSHAIRLGDTISRSGMVSPEQARAWKEDGVAPNSWCGWTSNKTAVHLEWTDEYNPLTNLIEQLENGLKSVLYNFEYSRIEENPELVRIVFWFDN